MRFVAILLCLWPGFALAQTPVLPELFSAGGEESGKVQVRAEPRADAAVIGELAGNARNIEVMDFTSGWGAINIGEQEGWVALGELKLQTDTWQNGKLPVGLSCFGTEPFWSMQVKDRQLVLQTPDQEDQNLELTQISDRGYPEDRIRALQATNLTGVIFPQDCNDGMSERRFGLQVVLMQPNATRPMLSGCCTVAPH